MNEVIFSYNILILIQDITTRVVQYDYRRATLNHPIAQFKVSDEFVELLAQKAGKSLDNHLTWLITLRDGTEFALAYNDGYVSIGLGGVTEGRW